MTGRHERCEVCGQGLVQVVNLGAEEITSCGNHNCPTHAPTGPIPVTNADRAAAEIEHIKRGLHDRLRADDTGGWHRRLGND
jgi:hypothetical protein